MTRQRLISLNTSRYTHLFPCFRAKLKVDQVALLMSMSENAHINYIRKLSDKEAVNSDTIHLPLIKSYLDYTAEGCEVVQFVIVQQDLYDYQRRCRRWTPIIAGL